MDKEMTKEEFQEFLNTIDTLPKKEYEIIRRGVLQLNDDKKALVREIEKLIIFISELGQDIDRKITFCTNEATGRVKSDKCWIAVKYLKKLKNMIEEVLNGGENNV